MGILRGEEERYMAQDLIDFYKAVTWRVIATLITFIVAWTVTGKPEIALGIAWVDTIIKIVAYMGHEKGWRWILTNLKIN